MKNKSKTIVCFGAGPAYKGGMANYNTSLAKAFSAFEDVDVHIVSWSQQYPGIVPREFKDKVSSLNFLENSNISCRYITNYNNPFSWAATAKYIASLNPDKVIIQWSIALQGLPISSIIKKLKKLSDCEIIIDLHFVAQKEKSSLDKKLTKMGIRHADAYIVHALKTYQELRELFPKRKFMVTQTGERKPHANGATPVIKLFHPVYEIYQPHPGFDVQAFKKEHGLKEHVFLFFGFIRKYKGLHHALEAFRQVAEKRDDVSFLICGELFWNTLAPGNLATRLKKGLFRLAKRLLLNGADDEQDYNPLALIGELGLQDKTTVVSQFIPNQDVHKYFQAANASVLFYSKATPSGIEALSYNFNLPVLTTQVGHFPETIEAGKNGYMVKANTVEAMAETMLHFLENPVPQESIARYKSRLSWENYAAALLERERNETIHYLRKTA